jgi:hypothetical protein
MGFLTLTYFFDLYCVAFCAVLVVAVCVTEFVRSVTGRQGTKGE